MGRKKRKNWQSGGLLSNFFGGFGGGNGMGLISQIGNALQGFSGEPALKNIFSQSNSLMKGFETQVGQEKIDSLGGTDKLKPVFDLFSLFSNGMFGGGYQAGGAVEMAPGRSMSKKQISKVKKRFGEFKQSLKEEIAESVADQSRQKVIQAFNMQHSQDQTDPTQIIPGLTSRPNSTRQRGTSSIPTGASSKLQQGGMPIPSGYQPEDWFTRQEYDVIQDQYNTLRNYMDSGRYRRRLRRLLNEGDTVESALRKRNALLERSNALVVPDSGQLEPEELGRTSYRAPEEGTTGDENLLSRLQDIVLRREGVVDPNAAITQTTPIHEYTHASTLGETLFSEKERDVLEGNILNRDDYMEARIGPDWKQKLYADDEEVLNTLISHSYLSNPTEVHARVNEVRKLATETGLHNKFGKKFTKKDIELLIGEKETKSKKFDWEKGHYRAFRELWNLTDGDKDKLLNLLNKTAAVSSDKYRNVAQMGGTIPVSSQGQFDFPGQPVMVPTRDGSITMNGVNQDLLAIQNGRSRILPANSGMHQFNAGNVLEIPISRQQGGSVDLNRNIAKGMGAIENVENEIRSFQQNDPSINPRQIALNLPLSKLASYQEFLETVNNEDEKDVYVGDIYSMVEKLGGNTKQMMDMLGVKALGDGSKKIELTQRNRAVIRNALKGSVSNIISNPEIVPSEFLRNEFRNRLRRDQPIVTSGFQLGGNVIPPRNAGLTIPSYNNGKVERKRKKRSQKVNKSNSQTKTSNSTLPARTSTRFHKRNKRQNDQNKAANVGYPFGRKIGF